MNKLTRVSKKLWAMALVLSMVLTSLVVTDAQADAKKAKVSKVKITKPSTSVLVLKKGKKYKIKTKVTATKKKYKKVTFKSSKKKVATVSKSGVIKAKKKGTTKITVTSKTNKKKKATLTVKVGTPVTKVLLTGSKVRYEKYYKEVTNIETGVKSNKEYTREIKTKAFTKKTSTAVTIKTDESLLLSASFNPKKATYRKVKYTSNKKSIASVNENGIVTANKVGTAWITATSKDGSGKKAKVKVTIVKAAEAPTPTPVYETETRTKVMVEDFEKYEVGTDGYDWMAESGYTIGKDFLDKNVGTMKVVQDPEDANNKCLKIDYTGDTQAYDFAPVFHLKLDKKLSEYSAIQLQSRVVSDSEDCTYKTVAGYFDKINTITPSHYFDTTYTKSAEGNSENDILHKFDVNASMVKGQDKEYNVKEGTFAGKKYNNKSFPMYYSAWSEAKTAANCSAGFKENETDAACGWNQNTLNFEMANIKTAIDNKGATIGDTLLESRNVDFVVGSTYTGKYKASNVHLTLYIDNLAMLEGEVPCNSMALNPGTKEIGVDMSTEVNIDYEDLTFDPANTTQKEVTWSSSDPETVEVIMKGSNPLLVGKKAGKATITATNVKNPAVTASCEITVFPRTMAAADFDVNLGNLVQYMAEVPDGQKGVYSNVQATYAGGTLTIPYTKANSEFTIIDLGTTMDLSQYTGIAVTGNTPAQMSVEIYPDTLDLSVDKWWVKQLNWCTYPFYQGSFSERTYQGTPVKAKAGAETVQANWPKTGDEFVYDTSGKKSDNTDKGRRTGSFVLRGSLKNSRYIMLKANKFKATSTDEKTGEYKITGIKFCKDEYINNNKPDSDYDASELLK